MLAKLASFSQKKGRHWKKLTSFSQRKGKKRFVDYVVISVVPYPAGHTHLPTSSWFVLSSFSPSLVFLETVCKQCIRNRLFFSYHIQYYQCPQPLANLRVRIQALNGKKTWFKEQFFWNAVDWRDFSPVWKSRLTLYSLLWSSPVLSAWILFFLLKTRD